MKNTMYFINHWKYDDFVTNNKTIIIIQISNLIYSINQVIKLVKSIKIKWCVIRKLPTM